MAVMLQTMVGATFGPAGANHAQGLVPDPGPVANSPPNVLGDDGAFHPLSVILPLASPTAHVGLSAVNGSATTAMRSDGAPAIDQSISPTWTGSHTWTQSITVNGANDALNIGSPGTSNTPAVNFFSSGNPVAYDARLVATGGNSSQGGATLVCDGTLEVVPQASSLQTAIETAQSAHGTTGGTQLYNNLINITSDDAACGTSAATSYAIGLNINYAFGGSNATGGREGFFSDLILTAATSSGNTVDFYVAASGQGQANASDGGTLGASAKGRMYGSNFIGVLSTGATGFKQCSASYDQIFWLTGSSGNIKVIGQFVYGSTDAVQGGTTDAAIGISAESGASAGGKVGILIGDYLHTGTAPLATSGTIMATVGSSTVATGIDLSSYTISGNFLKSTGFTVSGVGAITSGTNGGTGGSLTLNGSTSGSFAVSASSTGSPQYGGTATNDSAPAGDVGEYINSTVVVGSPVSLANGTPKNITSIALTAGDWDVCASIGFTGSGGVVSQLIGSISSSTGALDQTDTRVTDMVYTGTNLFATGNPQFPVGPSRFSLSGSTTVFLVADAGFTGSCSGFGAIRARRVR